MHPCAVRPQIPRTDAPALLALCHELSPGQAPVSLAVKPVSHAVPNDCFSTVRRQARVAGGDMVHGWQVWEWPGLFLEAEFHAVWRDRAGELRDITPKSAPVASITFVVDPLRVFSGMRVPNVRRALTADPRVRTFIEACEDEWQLLYRGERASQREILLDAAERAMLALIEARKQAAARALGLAAAVGDD
jgi:hypothetical protein